MTRPGRLQRTLFVLGGILLLGVLSVRAQPLQLILPTQNDALFRGDGPGFYQYTDRYFKGKRSRPWQGGQYGFVRNAQETPQGIVYSRFHEGVDIKPVQRDGKGEPLDVVHAIDAGQVVYVNNVEKESNYGKYVVVEHWWGESPYYSLYAHLNSVQVRAGQAVRQGDRLGQLGYTGVGINRRRAHVHFEINLLLNRSFQAWYDDQTRFKEPNYHGLFNGINMAGIDVPGLYLALREDPTLTIPAFLARESPFFKVTVPNTGMPDLLWRYPWLSPTLNETTIRYRDADRAASWDIFFMPSGLPVLIEPSDWPVQKPVVTMLEESPISYRYLTGGMVEGEGKSYSLTESGLRQIDLLMRPYEFRPRRVEW